MMKAMAKKATVGMKPVIGSYANKGGMKMAGSRKR